MTHRPRVPDSTGRTYAPLIGAERSGAMGRPEHRATRKMASPTTPREGNRLDGCSIDFASYLRTVACAELERATGELRADAYAVAHPEKPQVHGDPTLDDLREHVEEVQLAVRFLELVEEVEREE
jgi:hypothetical protein